MKISFTGHRPDKIVGFEGSRGEVEVAIRKRVAEEILRLVGEGADTFLSGMAPGFDLWAADEVLRLRGEGRIGGDVRLVLAIPYPNFDHSFGAEYRPLYQSILECADEVVYTSCGYHHGCYARRNDYLAENADTLLAYYEGTEGGTRYTIRKAEKEGKRVINIHQPRLFE